MKVLERAFRAFAKKHFKPAQAIHDISQTRTYIAELHRIIHHFEEKYQEVPDSIRLLFHAYNTRQEQMLFDAFKKQYTTRNDEGKPV